MDTTSLVNKHANKTGEKLTLTETTVADVKKADFQHHKATQQWLQYLTLLIQNETRAQHEQMQRQVARLENRLLEAIASLSDETD